MKISAKKDGDYFTLSLNNDVSIQVPRGSLMQDPNSQHLIPLYTIGSTCVNIGTQTINIPQPFSDKVYDGRTVSKDVQGKIVWGTSIYSDKKGDYDIYISLTTAKPAVEGMRLSDISIISIPIDMDKKEN